MTGRAALADVDLLIGIDDTDNPYTPGTGRRARALLHELQAAGLGSPAGATRHQLLVDDRIPYTSHNSSACLPGGAPTAIHTQREPGSSNSPGDSSNGYALPMRTPGWPSSFRANSPAPRRA